ncbi:MAG: helix-turn-helix domain-containing protein [Clostridia bacterium]|nr:helix-turn-helix domain-containing protein [Clostridia bacterium]
MIVYTKFWETLKKKDISQYKLTSEYKISFSLLDKLRKNAGITTHTLNRLCRILDCRVEDILEYVPDPADDGSSESHEMY